MRTSQEKIKLCPIIKVAFKSYLNLTPSRDPAKNTSGLTLEQLSAFRTLEEITGTTVFVKPYVSFLLSNILSVSHTEVSSVGMFSSPLCDL